MYVCGKVIYFQYKNIYMILPTLPTSRIASHTLSIIIACSLVSVTVTPAISETTSVIQMIIEQYINLLAGPVAL